MSKFEVRQRERDEARKAAVVARRLEKEKESRTEETSEYFTEHFSLQKTGTCVFTVPASNCGLEDYIVISLEGCVIILLSFV